MKSVAFFLLMMVGVAQAAEAPANDGNNSAPLIELTKADCQRLSEAIHHLDGHPALDSHGEVVMTYAGGVGSPTIIPYAFGAGTIGRLADDEVLLDKVKADIDAAAKARKEHEAPGETVVDPASPEGQKLMAEYANALKESIKLPLKTITREDLRIDANRLSASDVAALRFIIEKTAN